MSTILDCNNNNFKGYRCNTTRDKYKSNNSMCKERPNYH